MKITDEKIIQAITLSYRGAQKELGQKEIDTDTFVEWLKNKNRHAGNMTVN